MSDDAAGQGAPQTPLEMLVILASQQVSVTPTLRHIEMYTSRGLLTMFWHEPHGNARPVGVVMVGGAMGGTIGPGEGLYAQWGDSLAELGIPSIRLSYRKPNDMDSCCVDTAAAVQMLVGSGADKVVLMGHSFGGAVAVRVGVGLSEMVAGVVTFATQSAGCEVAAGLQGRPFLLFHGTDDSILPVESSEIVRAMAGTGDLHLMPGDDHLLYKSHGTINEIVMPWIVDVFSSSDNEQK